VTERDATEHRIDIKASGMEQRGKGSATALITAWVEPAGEATTRVRFKQDITVSGAVAQFSRGMMQDVSGKLTKAFADCLKTNITAEQDVRNAEAAATAEAAVPDAATTTDPTASSSDSTSGDQPAAGSAAASAAPAAAGPAPSPKPAPVATAKSIGGIRLGLWAFWRAIVRFFQRLFGGKPKDDSQTAA